MFLLYTHPQFTSSESLLHTPLLPLQPHFFPTVKPILCCLDHENVLAHSGKIIFPPILLELKPVVSLIMLLGSTSSWLPGPLS